MSLPTFTDSLLQGNGKYNDLGCEQKSWAFHPHWADLVVNDSNGKHHEGCVLVKLNTPKAYLFLTRGQAAGGVPRGMNTFLTPGWQGRGEGDRHLPACIPCWGLLNLKCWSGHWGLKVRLRFHWTVTFQTNAFVSTLKYWSNSKNKSQPVCYPVMTSFSPHIASFGYERMSSLCS